MNYQNSYNSRQKTINNTLQKDIITNCVIRSGFKTNKILSYNVFALSRDNVNSIIVANLFSQVNSNNIYILLIIFHGEQQVK